MQMKLSTFCSRIFLFSLVVSLFASFSAQAAETENANKLAAKVNNTEISMKTLDMELANTRQRMQMMGMPMDEAKLTEMKARILDNLIGMELIYQESKKEKIAADSAAIAAQLDKIKKQFPSEEEFAKGLEAQDLTEEELRNQMVKGMAIEQYIKTTISSKIVISDAELKTFYSENPEGFKKEAQVKARHILIKVDKNADEATKNKAREEIDAILVEAKKGGDFAELAKTKSQGPSATRGGDLGFFTHKQMVKPFADAAFAMKPGEVSEVVETQFGYHIIKTEEKKDGSVTPFEEVKPKIEKYLRDNQIRQKVMEKVEGLKSKAKIERFNS